MKRRDFKLALDGARLFVSFIFSMACLLTKLHEYCENAWLIPGCPMRRERNGRDVLLKQDSRQSTYGKGV